MAEDLYEQYAGLLDQQVDLAEEAVIGVVRAAFGDFSIDFKRHLRSLVPPRRRPPDTSGAPSSNKHLICAQEVIETARDSAQRQIATALANGFGALSNLPSALGFSANQPSVFGMSTQANASAITGSNNDDNSDTNEMPTTAGTLNVNPNHDNMSIKTEIESECDSSDSESSDEEEELTAVREIKEEIDDVHSNDQIMGNSLDENDGMQMIEERQEENESLSIDNSNLNDYNFETVQSPLVNSNDSHFELQSDAMMIENDEAGNEGEGRDEPTIIVVNYEEFDAQSIGNPNQDTVVEGSWNEESENIAGPDEDFVDIDNSNEDFNEEQESETMMMEASSEQDQAGYSVVSNPASTLTRRSARTSTSRTVNYSEAVENSLVNQQDTSTGSPKSNRKTGRSGKSNASKRSRVMPARPVASDRTDESEDEDSPQSGTISLSVIVRRLKCPVPGCNEVFPSKVQLVDHLLVKHAIEKHACKVKDCTESYATWTELTTHRNSAHDNLDNSWPCGQCEVTCTTYQNLYTHTWNYHEYGLFACSVDKCDFTEKTRIKVQTHHLKHRPAKYRCTYPGCSSSFNKKSHLSSHLRVHSKEKPFLCSQCPKAFAHKSHWIEHERIHSGFKPFSCAWQHCDYTASNQSHVIVHIRSVHFGLPKSKKKQTELRIIDNRDARLFVKKSTTTDN